MTMAHSRYVNVPGEELKCIWMDAGLVAYKLCDMQYRCEECPFDEIMRRRDPEEAEFSINQFDQKVTVQAAQLGAEPPLKQFEHMVDNFLAPLIDLPSNGTRYYHQNHMWVCPEDEGTFRLGADHCVSHVLGGINSVVFSQVPIAVKENMPCVWLVHDHGTIALRSPLPGRITACNHSLVESPHLINSQPYADGWLFRMRSGHQLTDFPKLLPTEAAREKFREQEKSLRKEFLRAYRRMQPQVGKTLYDGGRQLHNLVDILGPKKYLEIVSRIL